MGLLDSVWPVNGWSLDQVQYSPTIYIWTILAVLLVAIVTRMRSSQASASTSHSNGAKRIPAVPYWLPILGHIPNLAFGTDGFVRRLRDRYCEGLFSLNLAGMRHNVVYAPDLVESLLNANTSDAASVHSNVKMLHNIFGLPAHARKEDNHGLAEIVAKADLLRFEPGLSNLLGATERCLRQNIKDLVTGNDSEVDMLPWERVANVEVRYQSSGEAVIETDLLSLLRDFTGYVMTSSIMGTNFLENSPTFLTDLWTLDRAFLLMAAGLPRWVPIPSVTSAHIARRRMLENLSAFHTAIQSEHDGKALEPKWANLDNVSKLIRARNGCYRSRNLTMTSRAALDLALLSATNANSSTLIFWLILRIYSDKALLALLREELAPYVTAVQPPKELAFAEPPRLEKLDVEGVCNKCPLLKSCYVECLRLDAAPWSTRIAQRDFVLQSHTRGSSGWRISKGDYCHVAHNLHFMDPTVFEDPTVFRPDRHIKHDEVTKETIVDLDSIGTFGHTDAFREVMMFTSAIMAMWNVEPAQGTELKLPPKRRAAAVYGVKNDVRVRLTYRTLPASVNNNDDP